MRLMSAMRSWLTLGCTVGTLLPPSTVVAQARIDRIIPARQGVTVQRAGALAAERGLVGTTFQPGDLLSAPDASKLELRCTTAGATVYRFDGPFRVLVDVPVNGRCQLTVLAGHADVLAEEPSHTTGGTIPLASKGTQYAVDVTRIGRGFACTAVVFEGELVARATGRAVTAGTTFSWNGPEMVSGTATNQQILRSAAVYASFDLAAARAAIATPAEPQAVRPDTAAILSRLTSLHYKVLANPMDTGTRVVLAKQQMAYRVDEQAAYNLRRANVTTEAAMRRYKIDPAAVRQGETRNTRVPPSAVNRADAAKAATSTGSEMKSRAATSAATTAAVASAQTSRDYLLLAKAADGQDAAKARQNATLALFAHATDAKLSDAELKDLRELLGRLP